MCDAKGKIQTVLGCIAPGDAGVVLAHEHLSACTEALMVKEAPVQFPELCRKPVTADMRWWLLQHPYSNFDNTHLYEEMDAVVEEMKFFKANGGGTVVDNTTLGIQRDVNAQVRIAKESGVHVVAGAGYYVDSSRPDTTSMTVEEMADVMTKEITVGCSGSDIKAGVIGELGCSWPLAESERRCLIAAAHVENATGCPVIMHPGRNCRAPFEMVRVYQEAGGRPERLVMSHMDRTIIETSELLEFAAMGCYIEYDLFGLETSFYQLLPEIDMPGDGERIHRIKTLVEAGFEDRITVAHDIHTKHRLMKYGGHGFSHLLLSVVPRMLTRGISQNVVYKLLKHNPQSGSHLPRLNCTLICFLVVGREWA
ncbi:PTER-like protein [Mya arenaria]|uniref:PTER-like protein n=2 Tax=Mya arenaria TaxID=6604 RepID=A0ABY7F8N8_MYAAR|nr:phosphotriesterase-related protein-like isoform X2 [Mya arenaria]WAR17382.1 PTER-like protein [Mya arenaria]